MQDDELSKRVDKQLRRLRDLKLKENLPVRILKRDQDGIFFEIESVPWVLSSLINALQNPYQEIQTKVDLCLLIRKLEKSSKIVDQTLHQILSETAEAYLQWCEEFRGIYV
jgi:hypothetical protein